MHNMGASYSYPVDSLRSPSFTQKYGTTPSIMDYARNNFVAQPGDVERGVKLTPPVLGVYDIYAINWGYRLIPGADTPEAEKPTLRAWIEAKKGDPMFTFGAQQFIQTVDPTDQTEDLGDNHIKASNLAINNIKTIVANLEAWTFEEGEPYDDVETMYGEVVKQYTRHLRHVMPYIGGVRYDEIRQGEAGAQKTYLGKAEQKEAMQWLVEQARTYNAWLTPAALLSKFSLDSNTNDKLLLAVVGCLYNGGALFRISEGEKLDPKQNYTLNGYLDDVTAELFRPTRQGRKLDATEMQLQNAAVAAMIKLSGLAPAAAKSVATASARAFDDVMASADEPQLPCSMSGCDHAAHDADATGFARYNIGLPAISADAIGPVMTGRLRKLLTLYKQQRAAVADSDTRDFYDYQILKIEKLFEK
jgi:hypothetical protein